MSETLAFPTSADTLRIALIDAALERFLSLDPTEAPDTLVRAMRYGALMPAKRIRPLLVTYACEACAGSVSDALPAACAIEMVHAFSLIHDDLPSMDDDDLRRGKPTTHRVFGEAQAILAGDALLAYAFDVLAREIDDPRISRECMLILARASGPIGMTGGQSTDMEAKADFSQDEIELMHARKTGALIDAAVHMGAVIAGADHAKIIALRTYATHLGLAFQISDDILDAVSTSVEAGKGTGKDRAAGKKSFVAHMGLERSRTRVRELVDRANEALRSFDSSADSLERIALAMPDRRT